MITASISLNMLCIMNQIALLDFDHLFAEAGFFFMADASDTAAE